MKRVELQKSKRLSVLMEMVRTIKDVRDPHSVMELFLRVVQQAFEPASYLALSTKGLDEGEYRIVRWRTADGVEHVTPGGIGHIAEREPIHHGGLLGELSSGEWPKLIHELAVSNDSVLGEAFAEHGSVMAAPVFDEGDTADWVLLFHKSPRGFTVDDVEALIALVNLTCAAVNFAQLRQHESAASQRVHHEVDQIAAIQKVLMPDRPPDVPGLSVATSYKSFDRAGGDYCDVFPLRQLPGAMANDDRWLVLIADSAGHGPAAAVMMTVINAVLFTYPYAPTGPSEIIKYLNRHLHDRHQATSMVTGILGFYEPQPGRLVYANAGHNPPLLRSPGPPVRVEEVLLGAGLPLGILAEHDAHDLELTLQPGETLLLYTDGVPDERDAADEPFGMERITELLRSDGEPDALVQTLECALLRHQGVTMPEDDQTIVALKRTT